MRRSLEQRPRADDTSGQLLWMVDVIFACNEAGLQEEAAHLRRALGHLGKFLEEGEMSERDLAFSELAAFERELELR